MDFFEKLIEGHFKRDKNVFCEFFRLDFDQFNFVILLVKSAITPSPCIGSKSQSNPYPMHQHLRGDIMYIIVNEIFHKLTHSIICFGQLINYFLRS